ncbi:MAG TPA: cation-translocating P-type ATPase [Acidobacteriaceae bacterium]|nr:cation-translocating P-type ATPase [Acidobacteriaceae bacterium]
MSHLVDRPNNGHLPEPLTDKQQTRNQTLESRHDDGGDHEHEHGKWLDIVRVLFVALAAAVVWFHLWEPFHRVSVIGLAATLIGGYPIFREALENILERRMTMELSMTIALVSALAISEFFTALVITAFVLAAEILEGLTVRRGRRAIRNMLQFLPQTASIVRGDAILDVPTQSVAPGDTVLIRPGSHIPVDGVITSGHSFVEQAAITGESMPVEKRVGASVFAGTLNQAGTLHVRAELLGKDTTFGRIVEAVEKAEHSRAPIQKMADRLAGYLVYFALGAAMLTFLITHNVRSTISVVIVAGACGIAAGTPLAILGAIGRAARQGSVIKGGIYLEALGNVDTVFLDKTGTLTFGLPAVTDVRPAPGISPEQLMEAAAGAERNSEHPLGRAIVRWAEQNGIGPSEPRHFEYHLGRGVLALVDGRHTIVGKRALLTGCGIDVPPLREFDSASEVLVAQSGRYIGSIHVTDELRPSALNAVQALHELKIGVVVLTGDTKRATESLAGHLGILRYYSELLPHEKATAVTNEVRRGRIVAMVGDGINDAPALAEATVGVAMGAGTDVARESADVVLIGNDLMKFVETVKMARKCRRVILENFYGTLTVDLIGIGLAAAGMLNPLLAAFIHVASEMTFILNSTRLLPAGTPRRALAPNS